MSFFGCHLYILRHFQISAVPFQSFFLQSGKTTRASVPSRKPLSHINPIPMSYHLRLYLAPLVFTTHTGLPLPCRNTINLPSSVFFKKGYASIRLRIDVLSAATRAFWQSMNCSIRFMCSSLVVPHAAYSSCVSLVFLRSIFNQFILLTFLCSLFCNRSRSPFFRCRLSFTSCKDWHSPVFWTKVSSSLSPSAAMHTFSHSWCW